MLDIAAADMLLDLHEELLRRQITLRLAQMNGPVRDLLRRVDVEQRFGVLSPNMSIESVIEDWQHHSIDTPIRQQPVSATGARPTD